ncbi:MAG: PIG-L family deacetylase [Vicinamibacteria bacterium]|nr:PIG-L family deacetylase [Vicinamibacteria bacterium]
MERHLRFILLLGSLLTVSIVITPSAGPVTDERGLVGLQLVLRKLAATGTVMHVTAHPDDENNSLMARQSHGQGLRVILATATRGNGGQNEIGPELFEALGVLRSEELRAAHRFDGAEQMFGRAIDFGYSFSVDETFKKWGKDEILGDYVRLVRMTRPDVMITMRPDLHGGGQHHQASAIIGLEAFRAAADPNRYPEQIKEGLRPWQAPKIYKVGYYGFFHGEPEPPKDTKLVAVESDVYDPLLGRTYAEIGSEARAMHKCQGFGQLLALPGSFSVKYQLADTAIAGQQEKEETSLVDGLDLSLPGLARFAGSTPPPKLVAGLRQIADAVGDAIAALRAPGDGTVDSALARGHIATKDLRAELSTLGMGESAVYEIDFRLARTEALFRQALTLTYGLRIEALADDGVVTPGQPVKLRLLIANRGTSAVTLKDLRVKGFDGEAACEHPSEVAAGGIVTCEKTVSVPAAARMTEPYWRRDGTAERYVFDKDAPFGQPFLPTPFTAVLTVGDRENWFPIEIPIENRYEGSIFSGEKRTELLVVPSISVRVTPDIAIVPLEARNAAREVRVTITGNAPGSADADVALDLPRGWRATPATARVHLARADEAVTSRFMVYPPMGLALGAYTVAARVTSGARIWTRGYDIVEYPHTRRQHIYVPATTTIKALEVQVPPGLSVGYVMGAGDQVPLAIEQLGATVRLLDENDLASADLSKYDAIVTGVRAYERRKDLRAYNHRLIEYARNGGTVLVQYNKFEFNQAQYGPWPAKVSSNRVTDETAAVRVLVPEHPVFTLPNPVDAQTWAGWVQERGLYFLGERDPQYTDLVELADPFPDNEGPKRGALVEARLGKGRWVYVGLGLWRQLPAGTDGAYRLLANLISLGAARP